MMTGWSTKCQWFLFQGVEMFLNIIFTLFLICIFKIFTTTCIISIIRKKFIEGEKMKSPMQGIPGPREKATERLDL